jgi:hypothetical protein
MDADRAEGIVIDDEPECEGTTRVERGDVRYTIGGDPGTAGNGVAYARWRADEVEARVAELIAVFRERAEPFTWSIGPLTDAPGLPTALAARGLRRQRDTLIVTAPIPLRGRLPAHDLRLVEEHDERTVTDALRLDRDVVGAELLRRIEQRLAYLRCPTRRGGGVVAYRRDLAVGYGRWRYGSDDESVFLPYAQTLQPHRRTGVYATILAYRLDRAVRDGRTIAVAAPERATTAPILMRKGFREIAARSTWIGA